MGWTDWIRPRARRGQVLKPPPVYPQPGSTRIRGVAEQADQEAFAALAAWTELMVTLWPSFPHFQRFSQDDRLDGGIRLNSAMIELADLDKELGLIGEAQPTVPLHFDIKGRQMRTSWVDTDNTQNLDMRLNHPIKVKLPVPVLFKAGEDSALLVDIQEDGHRLIFEGGPEFNVRVGESIHIRHPSLEVCGPLFTDAEKDKIAKVRAAGIRLWFLSYVEEARDLDEFRELIGDAAEVRLKIESQRGLEYVERAWKKRDGFSLVNARGDLYVELERPHEILAATKLIIDKDPEATVGSRILLSTFHDPVPSCADFSELAWLYDIGYRRVLLCDEMCLKEEALTTAVGAFQAFRESYSTTSPRPTLSR